VLDQENEDDRKAVLDFFNLHKDESHYLNLLDDSTIEGC